MGGITAGLFRFKWAAQRDLCVYVSELREMTLLWVFGEHSALDIYMWSLGFGTCPRVWAFKHLSCPRVLSGGGVLRYPGVLEDWVLGTCLGVWCNCCSVHRRETIFGDLVWRRWGLATPVVLWGCSWQVVAGTC